MATFVKKFSQQMKTIQDTLKPLSVKVVGLNHVESKYKRHRYNHYNGEGSGYTKGVDSDHIKIFEIGLGLTFAFSFYFTKVETPYIVASFKKNSKITASSNYKEEAFKKNLNQFIKLLTILKTADSLTVKTIESTFLSTFIEGNEFNGKDVVSSVLDSIIPSLKSVKTKYSSELKEKELVSKTFASKKLEIKKAVDAAKKELKVNELKAKLDEALAKVYELEEKLTKSSKLRIYEVKGYTLDNSIREYNNEVESIVSKALQSVPKAYREAIREKIKGLL